jgi:hypothetical protein
MAVRIKRVESVHGSHGKAQKRVSFRIAVVLPKRHHPKERALGWNA